MVAPRANYYLATVLLFGNAARGTTGTEPDVACVDDACLGQDREAESELSFVQKTESTRQWQVSELENRLSKKAKGARWTEDLVTKVLEKLRFIMEKGGRVMNQLYPPAPGNTERLGYECMVVSAGNDNGTKGCWHPGAGTSAKKFLRMGFHDCVKYADGSGGCDGCLGMKDMFIKYDPSMAGKDGKFLPDEYTGNGDNNNLAMSADVLEAIYTDKAFPKGGPTLNKSLKEGGQSRADLWALATLLAAQYGFKANEDMCSGKADNNIQKALSDYGRPNQCSVKTSSRLKFYSGRADCTEAKPDLDDESRWYRRRAWEIEKDEVAGNAHMDGSSLQNMMGRDFNFSPRETVALMGAHSFASFKVATSMFAYEWKRGTGNMLNNEYYQLIALKPHLNKQNKPFAVVGARGRTATNNTGGLAKTRWMIRRKNYLRNGGPYQWSHQYERCPYCKWNKRKGEWDMMEPGNGGSSYFRSNHCCNECSKPADDTTFDPQCLAWVSQDEEALAPDAGLYLNFSFDEKTGRPFGCNNLPSWTSWGRKAISPQCGKNMIENPGDGKTMSEIVEEYADSQTKWANDFIAALQKMLTNGADPEDLTLEYTFPQVDTLP
jgi:hypothetical protein